MNFQQLKIVRETVRQNFNLTEVGKNLFTSQPGVSKGLTELESELGIEIFIRSKNRLVGLSPAGESVIEIVEKILNETNKLKTLSAQLSNKYKGNLVLATTHAQARYSLPSYINKFLIDYPDVHLTIHQSSPDEICNLLESGEADIGIATEGIHLHENFVTIPWYEWYHIVVAQPGHPIFSLKEISLENLSQFPIITYHAGLTGRSRVDKAFQEKGLYPDIVLTALDADVIKTYVEAGLGIGIISSIAYDPEKDRNLELVSAEHLFERNITKIAFRKNHFVRDYVYDFVERLSPQHDKPSIEKLLTS